MTGLLPHYLSLAQLLAGAGVVLVGCALLARWFTQIGRISNVAAANQARQAV